MNAYHSLFAEILANMNNVLITQPNIQKGVLRNTECEIIGHSENSFVCIFDFIVTCDPIDFRFDGKKVNRAEMMFFLAVNNCQYDKDKGWSWSGGKKSINLISGYEEPNIITYQGDQALNNATLLKDAYKGGLTKAEDVALARKLPEKMFKNTHDSLLIMVIDELLSKTPSPCLS